MRVLELYGDEGSSNELELFRIVENRIRNPNHVLSCFNFLLRRRAKNASIYACVRNLEEMLKTG